MGKPKHRWTLEEENALRAGVDKYGTGKWRKILTDEDFAPCFIARTNVDLKDKWRNLCGNASSRVAFPRCSTYKETNEVDEVVQEVDIKELEADINEVEVNIIDEVIVQDYAQVLREVGYEEHEINVAVDQVEVLNELPIARHVESAMPMNIEDYQDACLIDDTQESTLKPKLSLKLLFKAFKKPMLELKTSVEKMMRNKS